MSFDRDRAWKILKNGWDPIDGANEIAAVCKHLLYAIEELEQKSQDSRISGILLDRETLNEVFDLLDRGSPDPAIERRQRAVLDVLRAALK